MARRYLRGLEPEGKLETVGGKRVGLESLAGMGLRVPRTFICSAAAHRHFSNEGTRDRVCSRLRHELALTGLCDTGDVAVRSSATVEDGARESMAGQFRSYLGVRGVDRVVESIRSVWESAATVSGERRGGRPSKWMEVLIQEMIHPVASGVSFSRNPVTGSDEVIVEAVEGTSEALLQRGVTPQRWVIQEREVPSDWVWLPPDVLWEIARTTREVAEELHYPADLEWAYDGERLWWLQARPITTLRGLPVYSNRISREYLPGLVKPLVWSINVPMINGAWVDLFEELVGRLTIDPLSLAKRFHYRAYFNMSGMGQLFRRLGLAEDTLERLLGLVASDSRSTIGFRWRMLLHLPRVVRFAASLLGFHRRTARWVARRSAELDRKAAELDSAFGMRDLLNWAEEMLLLMRDTARLRILALLLHMAVGQLGRRVLARRGILDPSALEIADPRLDAVDPTIGMRRLARTFSALSASTRRIADEQPLEVFLQQEEAAGFAHEFAEFIERFGHLSENGNDFSATPWSRNLGGVLRMVLGQAAALVPERPDRTSAGKTRRGGRWARRVTMRRVDRERIGAVFSRGFYLLHLWARKVGRILEADGVAEALEDVFFLQLEELREFAEARLTPEESRERILDRKQEIAVSATMLLPEQILGDRMADLSPPSGLSDELLGIGVSRGVYEGTISVIHSLDEAGRFRDGEILVVPFSDVAWTPLFSRAGAIIAEAGGILSHSAIVARELGIPAVVSVPGACGLSDGTRVRVDGMAGRIVCLTAPRAC